MATGEVINHLAQLRARRGLGAAYLAAKIGISRQTIYAIEAGNYVPNTEVSLKLARILETTVEDLFQIQPDERSPDEIANAIVLGNLDLMAPGLPLRLCEVDGHLVAVAPEPGGWGLPSSDAILLSPIVGVKRNANAKIQILGDGWKKSPRILIAGCDPSAAILAHSLQPLGCELVIAYENSSRSLQLLHKNFVHVAGTHLEEKVTGKSDLQSITKMFSRNSVVVINYAIWKEGLVTLQGNPKNISGIPDLVRQDVRITNREPGAGCRRLLDDMLRKHDISGSQVNGYDRPTAGHLPAARLVRSGEVDCCISTQAVARTLGLDFIPLVEKPYHLVIRRKYLNLQPVQTLIEMLGRASFRREVESCTGYSMRTSGDFLVG
jgi:molybdate-binding protein/DNA-binding XRE family transcriptional regulator